MTTTSDHSPGLVDAHARVREVFLCLAKLIGARTLYGANNPTLARFRSAFERSVANIFETENELQLRIDQYRILWNDEVVYENEDHGGSIAFMLFKDGIGELTIHATVTPAELDQLVGIFKEEIHDPSPGCDMVNRLWNADFANISYRVLESDPTTPVNDEQGNGVRREGSAFQADDHPFLSCEAMTRPVAAGNENTESIAAYLFSVVNASRPQADDLDSERYIQDMLSTLFSVSGDEKRAFLEECGDDARADRVAMILDTAMDFTLDRDPTLVENALFLVERATSYAIDEGDARTLAWALTTIRTRTIDKADEAIRSAMSRLERSLVDPEFLHTLGRRDDLPTEAVLSVLRYLRLVGPTAVPVIQELLCIHTKPVIHREACDTLLAIAGDEIDGVIRTLDVDNVHIARDAVYLLGATGRGGVPPLLRELVHYPDVQVRASTLELLARTEGDDAISLMCLMLEDEDRGVRMRALAELERVQSDAAAARVLGACFDENAAPRELDERTRFHEAAGRLAGPAVVAHYQRVLAKRSWLRLGAKLSVVEKLMAVAALRHAAGETATALLERLAQDSDADVSAQAAAALATRTAAADEGSPR